MADENVGSMRAAIMAGAAESSQTAENLGGVLDELENLGAQIVPQARLDAERMVAQFSDLGASISEVLEVSREGAAQSAAKAVGHYTALEGSSRPEADQLRASASELSANLSSWNPGQALNSASDAVAASAAQLLERINELFAIVGATTEDATQFVARASDDASAAERLAGSQ